MLASRVQTTSYILVQHPQVKYFCSQQEPVSAQEQKP
jgi:hypothetical protein